MIFIGVFDVVEGMNEDGSFIGQYGKKRGDGSSAFATLV